MHRMSDQQILAFQVFAAKMFAHTLGQFSFSYNCGERIRSFCCDSCKMAIRNQRFCRLDSGAEYQVKAHHVRFFQRLCRNFYATIEFRIGYMGTDPARYFLFLPDLMYIIHLPD